MARSRHSCVVRRLVCIAACSLLATLVRADDRSGAGRPVGDVEIVTSRSYWTDLGGGMPLAPGSDPLAGHGGLFVVSGELANRSDRPVHHVVLRFELVDAAGAVVYHYDGYNRSAEPMLRIELDPDDTAARAEIAPIRPGTRDSYRMIFIGEDIPAFDHPTVRVLAVK